jgi:hypothetical protein
METLRCPRCGSDEELHLAVNYQSLLPLPTGAALKMAQIAVGPELVREEKLICNQCEHVGAPIYLMRTLLTVLFRRLGTPDLLDECLAEVDRQVPPPRSDLMGADMRVTVKRRVDELFDQLGG